MQNASMNVTLLLRISRVKINSLASAFMKLSFFFFLTDAISAITKLQHRSHDRLDGFIFFCQIELVPAGHPGYDTLKYEAFFFVCFAATKRLHSSKSKQGQSSCVFQIAHFCPEHLIF